MMGCLTHLEIKLTKGEKDGPLVRDENGRPAAVLLELQVALPSPLPANVCLPAELGQQLSEPLNVCLAAELG